MKMKRRSFLAGSLAGTANAAPAAGASTEWIDVHVYLSRWPFRKIIGDDTDPLAAQLRAHGVTQAWAGSFDTVFYKDMTAANERLAAECRKHPGLLVPFGGVNPMLPDWEEDLRRCRETFHMPGIRIHPAYHNYNLAHPAAGRLFQLAAERGMVVQIAAWMEDERHQNPLMQVPKVDLSPLPGLLEKTPGLRVVVLNGTQGVPAAAKVLAACRRFPNVAFDFAELDSLAEVRALINAAGLERVVFGSYAPMFYFSSAVLKMREAGCTEVERRAILAENARRLMAR